jgi:hypothetical protein
MRCLPAPAAAALLTLASPAGAKPFDWLVGNWCTAESKGEQTCESWKAWSRGRMRGEGRTFKAGKMVEGEATSISLRGGKASYRASPGGAPAVTFVETRRGRDSVAFENRGHDYPQRIRYWREGRALLAEISLADGGRAMRWRYTRRR